MVSAFLTMGVAKREFCYTCKADPTFKEANGTIHKLNTTKEKNTSVPWEMLFEEIKMYSWFKKLGIEENFFKHPETYLSKIEQINTVESGLHSLEDHRKD